ncbi:hypothetical protein DL546_003585 [Coniochaeta pulveracea]|uniref:C2H2-type domain-containing protein n=1 Tax=Coniochaeta pulveracea TaxID=177199 RepID=A0A420Y164_9PEZI|nr:hypothetical protein DL546_003585 [Coniochaeta pulveracea]
MASEKGSITADAPLLPPAAPQTASADAADLVANDPTRVKSLKRARETTPTSPAPAGVSGDLSPSKIARLVNFAQAHNQSPLLPPLTGAAALEDERRRKEEEQRQQQLHPPGSSENPSQKVLSELMSRPNAGMSRAQDDAAMLGAASSVPETAARDVQQQPPASLPNNPGGPTPTGMTVTDNNAQPEIHTVNAGERVVNSPNAMEIDSRNDIRPYAPQPDAQMEDRGTATSLSYPGILPGSGAMPAPAVPARGMSLPMAPSPNPERSPSLKKHKCPYCETEFTRHHNLKSHLLTHSQEKPYHCSECQMRFRRLHDLKRHAKLHTGEKPHICPKCNRKFARADALARHSKGAGGCAGRRPSMGSFGAEGEYEDMGDADESAMSGVLYDGTTEGDMTEEERRRLSLPSMKPPHAPGQAGQPGSAGFDGYRSASARTYPPAGPQPTSSGGLFPPNVDRGSTTTTSSGIPASSVSGHTPSTSVSSMPMSTASSSIFTQNPMTESPKPLEPGIGQPPQAGQDKPQRSSSLAHQIARQEDVQHQPGQPVPPQGTSDAAQSAWLSQYPPADAHKLKGQPHAVLAAGQPGAPGAGPGNGTVADNTNNMFASGEQGLWSYIQQLEDRMKALSDEVAAGKKTEAELLDRVGNCERREVALTAEVAQLRQQLGMPASDNAPARP